VAWNGPAAFADPSDFPSAPANGEELNISISEKDG